MALPDGSLRIARSSDFPIIGAIRGALQRPEGARLGTFATTLTHCSVR